MHARSALWLGWIAVALCACGQADVAASPAPAEPAPQREAAHDEAARDEAAQHEAAQHEAAQHEAAQHEAAQEAAQDEAPMWLEVDATGVAAQLRAHPARLLLVNLWSTWCEPCVEEMPMLLSTARRYEDRGLAVVLISTDPRSQREAAARFLDEHQIPRPRWIKSGSEDAFIQAVHPEWTGALPMTLLLDAERRVVRFREGAVTEEWLVEAIGALLADGVEGPAPTEGEEG